MSRNAEDKRSLEALGKSMDTAENNFRKVASNPNASPAELEIAKTDLEKTTRAFEAFLALKSAVGKIMQRIIDSMRSGG